MKNKCWRTTWGQKPNGHSLARVEATDKHIFLNLSIDIKNNLQPTTATTTTKPGQNPTSRHWSRYTGSRPTDNKTTDTHLHLIASSATNVYTSINKRKKEKTTRKTIDIDMNEQTYNPKAKNFLNARSCKRIESGMKNVMDEEIKTGR